MKKALIIVIIVALIAIVAVQFTRRKSSNSVEETNPIIMTTAGPTKAPSTTINPAKNYQAIFKTSAGDITIELYAGKTPITANNFITLINKGFYDNTIFHRAIKGFMIQGGDPKGDGTGGPGYKFEDEPFEGEYTRGIVAMANAGPNTNGSQFFIMHADYDLPKNYVIFGKVISGMEVVDKIAEAPVAISPSGEFSRPTTPIKIISAQIIEK